MFQNYQSSDLPTLQNKIFEDSRSYSNYRKLIINFTSRIYAIQQRNERFRILNCSISRPLEGNDSIPGSKSAIKRRGSEGRKTAAKRKVMVPAAKRARNTGNSRQTVEQAGTARLGVLLATLEVKCRDNLTQMSWARKHSSLLLPYLPELLTPKSPDPGIVVCNSILQFRWSFIRSR